MRIKKIIFSTREYCLDVKHQLLRTSQEVYAISYETFELSNLGSERVLMKIYYFCALAKLTKLP